MKFLSVCSGIEAASMAFQPIGWSSLAYAEIEPFPAAVLAYRHGAGRPVHMPDPDAASDSAERRERAANIKALDRIDYWGDQVVNQGDFTTLKDESWIVGADVLCGGTPCQSFSIAGLRAGLEDARGQLTLEFVRLADAIDALRLPAGKPGVVIIWENVPAVVSDKGNAFGCFLAGLVGADAPLVPPRGQRWRGAGLVAGPRRRAAWRTLDAQYFGLAQRRERVFVVSSARDDLDPSSILFEPEGLRRHSPPCREPGQRIARPLASGSAGGSGYRNDADTAENLLPQAFGGNRTSGELAVTTALSASHTASGRQDFETETFIVAKALSARAQASHREDSDNYVVSQTLRAEGCTSAVPVAALAIPILESGKRTGVSEMGGRVGTGIGQPGDPMYTLGTDSRHAVAVRTNQTGANGRNYSEDVALGVSANEAPRAVAFSLRGRHGESQAEPERNSVAPALRAVDGGSSHAFVAFAQNSRSEVREVGGDGQITGALAGDVGVQQQTYVAWSIMPQNSGKDYKARLVDVAQPIMAGGPVGGNQGGDYIKSNMAVRRITCVEAEILQGFPPNYTLIPWPSANRKGDDLDETVAYLKSHGMNEDVAIALAQTPDGSRYRAIGNSWAIPVVRWIGERIDAALSASAGDLFGGLP